MKNHSCGKNVKVEHKYAQRCSVKWEFRDNAKLERFLGTDMFMGPLWPFTAQEFTISSIILCFLSIHPLFSCLTQKWPWRQKPVWKWHSSQIVVDRLALVWWCEYVLFVWESVTDDTLSCRNILLFGWWEWLFFYASPFSEFTSAKINISAESIHPSHLFPLYPFTSSKSAYNLDNQQLFSLQVPEAGTWRPNVKHKAGSELERRFWLNVCTRHPRPPRKALQRNINGM